MKKFIVGLVAVVALTFTFAQAVFAWTAVFDAVNKQYEFSKTLTGSNIYFSTFGLRKLTAPALNVNMILYKQNGSSWTQMGNGHTCVFDYPIGIVNDGCKPSRSSSGTATYKSNWKQTNSGTMNASLDITTSAPW